MRKSKIVCTIGPSSSDISVMKNMITSGLDVARINMSHGEHSSHATNIKNLRKASKSVNKEIAILMDLQGPKIRVEKIKTKEGIPTSLILKKGDEWFICSNPKMNKIGAEDLSQSKMIPTSYKAIYKDVNEGDRVLFDDGLIEAEVVGKVVKSFHVSEFNFIKEELVKIRVLVGGNLKSNKGINLPDSDVSAPSLTAKDKKDLFFGLTQDIDFIALSFVRNADDILKVKKILKKNNKNIPIISKIEKPEAVKNIEEIIKVSDGIMIARGDMAVEMGVHLVPKIQKQIIILCNKAAKPVITATQMLESMTQNMSPTRAEASDVANAVWDGTDAVMLSGETASGIDPVNVINTMNRIVVEAETMTKKHKNVPEAAGSFTSNIQLAGCLIAENIQAKAIISVTEKGHSSQMLSSFRPKTKIFAITNNLKTIRRFCLMWGVSGLLTDRKRLNGINIDETILKFIILALDLKYKDSLVYCRAAGKEKNAHDVNYVKIETIP